MHDSVFPVKVESSHATQIQCNHFAVSAEVFL